MTLDSSVYKWWMLWARARKQASKQSSSLHMQLALEPFFICKIRIVISFRFIYFGPWILQPVIILWNKTEIPAKKETNPAIFNRASNRLKDNTTHTHTHSGIRNNLTLSSVVSHQFPLYLFHPSKYARCSTKHAIIAVMLFIWALSHIDTEADCSVLCCWCGFEQNQKSDSLMIVQRITMNLNRRLFLFFLLFLCVCCECCHPHLCHTLWRASIFQHSTWLFRLAIKCHWIILFLPLCVCVFFCIPKLMWAICIHRIYLVWVCLRNTLMWIHSTHFWCRRRERNHPLNLQFKF